MKENFVSISGVTDKNQLREVNEICLEENIGFKVAIGYQLSNKSINQGTKNSRQPRFKDLRKLVERTIDYNFVPAVHYYTKDKNTIIKDLETITKKISSELLLQFNTLPPSLDMLSKVKDMGFKIIFKVPVSDKQSPQGGYAVWKGEEVVDVSGGEVDSLITQIYDRRNVINYAMFDPSHGTNLELDLSKDSLAIKFGKGITNISELNHLGLVYAGGINPANVKSLTKSLLSFFPQDRISIDIESGIRKGNKLNIKSIQKYLTNYKSVIIKKIK